MNYNYQEADSPGQQKQQGYTIVIGNPQPPQQQQPEDRMQLTQEMAKDIHYGKMKYMLAEARNNESRLLLSYMRELRSAINSESLQVAEGDTGSKDRPPLEPAFRDDVRHKLQLAYLRLAERMVNHTEDLLKEGSVKMTNEIKLAPEGDKNE